MKPPHLGVFIRSEILQELNLPISQVAEVLGVRRRYDMLLRMQNSFDIAQAWKRQGKIPVAR